MSEPTRPRLARLLDAITHTGPGYDTTTEHPMPAPTREQLLHLAARARDGRALPAADDDYETTTGHEITCCAGFTDICTCGHPAVEQPPATTTEEPTR
ncbi:hypothetical protein OG244_28305 [Streptomyces brevispora]|uniref:hypothetical protein n=1 Tax=Streptomyces brevispora TaxID=887462 RepID=UPI002E341991|nr:hypothetical protein [Streptomyces brevispora]